jgi:hypothetical protein
MAEVVYPDVQIPNKAVADKEDVRKPTRDLLEDLYLLGSHDDTEDAGKIGAVLKGPPQSVAVIEAGATAATKWWSAGLGVAALLAWGKVSIWWSGQHDNLKIIAIAGVAFFSAAVAVAIGHMLASDVRGRASAAVATIEARAQVAARMIEAARDVYKPATPAFAGQLIPLPAGIKVKNLAEPPNNQKGWLAIAIKPQPDDKRQYVVVKGATEKPVDASNLQFPD